MADQQDVELDIIDNNTNSESLQLKEPTKSKSPSFKEEYISPNAAPIGNLNAYFDGEGFFGHRQLRIITSSAILSFFAILAFANWFDFGKKSSLNSSFNVAYGFLATGLLLIFCGLLLTISLQLAKLLGKCQNDSTADNNPTLNLFISCVFHLFGSLLYFIGGCILANSFNQSNQTITDASVSALAAIGFVEALFVCLITIVFGLDFWQSFLNPCEKDTYYRRILIFFLIYLLIGIISLFSYASADMGGSEQPKYNCVAAGWVFIMISIIAIIFIQFIVEKYVIVKAFYKHNTKIIDGICVAVMIFGGFLVAIGKFTMSGYDSGEIAYSWAYGFLVFLMIIFTCLDLRLGETLKKYCKK